MTPLPAADVAVVTAVGAWPIVGLVGFALGRLLTVLVGPLVDPPQERDPRVHRGIEAAAVLVALALWWWEVEHLGQLPAGAGAGAALPWRYAAHLVLLTLLAAATWVDARHRVIPDSITVPGALAGLVWIALAPSVLLPILHELPRPFAAPLRVPDVLAAWGGLGRSAIPDLFASWPRVAGLGAGVALFAAWWWICTAPFREPWPEPSVRMVALLGEPRNVVLMAGVAGVAAAWSAGGVHWSGLMTALIGMAVAGGIVLLTRAGASWAVGREAMGLGDVTLMAMVGAWLGWQACILACVGGVFVGLVHGVWQMALRREAELPFGPSLCLATAAVIVFWRACWARCGDFLAEPLDMTVVVGVVILLTAVGLIAWRRLRTFLWG